MAAVILGGGAGTRFGEPKAGAVLSDGRRFIDAICATARDAQLDPIVALLHPSVPAPKGVIGVVNPHTDAEQIASLRLGLARLANTPSVGAVVWPVDHPFVSLESLLAVLDAAQRTGAPIVRPEFEGAHGHPVFFHRDTWRELLTVADGGAREVVHRYGSREETVTVRDGGVLRNVDRRSDLDG